MAPIQTPSSALSSNYEGALPPTNQLILGILRLEETDDAVNGAQAATMLPLWQALQSGSIQNQSERAAILRQIEGALSEAQIEAIGAMQLTFTDMNDWAQASGIELPQFGQRGRQGQGGQGGQGGQARVAYLLICRKRNGLRFGKKCRICHPKSALSDCGKWELKFPKVAFKVAAGKAVPVAVDFSPF